MSFFIAIVGGSCSGKTTIAQALAQRLQPNVTVIAEDDYYHCSSTVPDFDERTFNFDVPGSKDHALLKHHLETARRGEAFEKPLYDFTTHRRRAESEHVTPKPVLIAEGMHLLVEPELRALFDLTVFMDTGPEDRLGRRLLRDVTERARSPDSILEQFKTNVQPMHAQYVEPQQSVADLVLTFDSTREIDDYVDEIVQRIQAAA